MIYINHGSGHGADAKDNYKIKYGNGYKRLVIVNNLEATIEYRESSEFISANPLLYYPKAVEKLIIEIALPNTKKSESFIKYMEVANREKEKAKLKVFFGNEYGVLIIDSDPCFSYEPDPCANAFNLLATFYAKNKKSFYFLEDET
jgi:hypothetical protein